MKKGIRTLVVALILMIGFNVQAAREFDVEVNRNQILMIELNDVQQGDWLTLLDVNGEVLFKEENLTQTYRKQLSMEQVPNGTYYLHLEDENTIFSREIVKSQNHVSVSDSGIIFKPTFKMFEDNKKRIDVSFTNPKELLTNLNVYDRGGKLVTSIANKDLVFKKTLDFSAVPSGEYLISLSTKDRSYYRYVTIK